jgi:hypothetical protein
VKHPKRRFKQHPKCKSFPAFLCFAIHKTFIDESSWVHSCRFAVHWLFRQKRILPELKSGIWRATVKIQGRELPFNFEVKRNDTNDINIYLINAEERLLLDEVKVNGDSVDIALHIFDANIKAVVKGDSLNGLFIKKFR